MLAFKKVSTLYFADKYSAIVIKELKQWYIKGRRFFLKMVIHVEGVLKYKNHSMKKEEF